MSVQSGILWLEQGNNRVFHEDYNAPNETVSFNNFNLELSV